MISLIRTVFICSTFFILLSITINEKPIFYHIYTVTSHITVPVQKLTTSIFSKAADSATAYSRKLFDNSVPKLKDAVRSKASAPSRSRAGGPPEEVIHVDEQRELEALIKNHKR